MTSLFPYFFFFFCQFICCTKGGLAASRAESILPPEVCRRCSTFGCCRRQPKQPVPTLLAASPRFTFSRLGAELMQFFAGHQGTFPHPTPSTFPPWVSESTQNLMLATDLRVEVSSALRPLWGMKASFHVPSLPWAISLPFSTLFPATNLPCWVCGKQLEGFHACSVLLLLYPPQQAWIYSNLPFFFLVFFFFFSAQLPTISAFWLTRGLKSVFPLPQCFLLQ